jgi:exosortase A
MRPSPIWLAAILALGFAWFWGTLAGLVIVEQFAFALLFPATVGAVLGTPMLRALLFPLAFLMLGVPAGDFISGPLIDFTAAFAVQALRISGIPVAREGPYLMIPNALWAVTDACSGFRYLMASLTLGCLYAYLQFRTWRYRLFFVALSLAVPILANGVRAYLIVLLGYLSDMKLAVGVDHYIYGWLLFAVFCLLLFWIGSRLREPPAPVEPVFVSGTAPMPRPALGRFAVVGVLAIVGIGLWPLLLSRVSALASTGGPIALELPLEIGNWRATEDAIAEWRPSYHGAVVETARAYRMGDRTAAIYIAYYRHQKQGAELINSTNTIIPVGKKVEWRRGWERERVVTVPWGKERVWETDAAKPGRRLLLWHRFWNAGQYTPSPVIAKMRELRRRMVTGKDDGALVVVLTPYARADEAPVAATTLTEFLSAAGPKLDALLAATAALP